MIAFVFSTLSPSFCSSFPSSSDEMIILRTTVLALLALLSACKPAMTVEDFADDASETKATHYLTQLLEGRYEELKNALEPSLRPKLTDAVLHRMREALGAEETPERILVGYNAHTYDREPTRYNLTYQFGYENRWVLVNIAFRTLEDGSDEIFGLNVYNPMSQSLQDANRFTLSGKRLVHFVFLFTCAAIPLFILATLVVCIRTKLERRKWLWILFILVGIVQFSLNWTTGQIGFRLVNFQLLGSGALAASVHSPWILSFSLPVGAFMFWMKRDQIRAKPSSSETPTSPVEPQGV